MRRFPTRAGWVPVVLACAAAPAHATQYLTVEQAQHLLFPRADDFTSAPVQLSAELKARIKTQTGVSLRGAKRPVWAARRAGELLGHVMLDNVIGKHELITYAVGIDRTGVLLGVEILDYRETRGGEVRDPRWRAQFVGKGPGSPLRLEEDIQNISGATLSCRHVTDGVRALVALHSDLLQAK
jgi:Na+-translocating ferredoxin:NAD+ oxidoreductase RnfG subunit